MGSPLSHAGLASPMPRPLIADFIISEPNFGGGRDTDAPAIDGAFALSRDRLPSAKPPVSHSGNHFQRDPKQHPYGFDRSEHARLLARPFVAAKSIPIADLLIANVIASARLLGDGRGATRSSAAFSALAMHGRGCVLSARKSAEPGADVAQQRDEVAKPPHLHKRSPCKENPNESEDDPQQQDRHYLQELHNIDYEYRRIVHAPPIARFFTRTKINSRLAVSRAAVAGGARGTLERIER